MSSPNINLIFGRQRSDSSSLMYPSAVHSFQLWQVFLSNVHPLTKLLHGPTTQKDIIQIISEPPSTPGPTEALIFAIYLVAVISMTDKECLNMFGEPRKVLLARYCEATEVALSRVDFLRSTDLRVLQAFTLHLLSLRHLCDHDILWLLTGLATRMGQRMGLHRESSLRGLQPFEAEIRRRVWWQIVILDGRASQLTGASMNPDVQLYGDTRQPLNLSDADLVPSASTLPLSSPVATDMVFCKVRIEIGVWMIQQKCLLSSESEASTAGKARFFKTIDELESRIEEKYLSKMDKDLPLNLLTEYLARSAICQLRLSMYHPIHRPERTSDLNAEQFDMLLENSLQVIRYDILSHSTPSMQCYLWHISNFFPYETFVLLISTLSGRTASPIVDTAWDVINQAFEHHPSFISDISDSLYWAIGNITMKAWGQRVARAKVRGEPIPAELPCIANLVRKRASLSNESQQVSTSTSPDTFSSATPESIPQTQGQCKAIGKRQTLFNRVAFATAAVRPANQYQPTLPATVQVIRNVESRKFHIESMISNVFEKPFDRRRICSIHCFIASFPPTRNHSPNTTTHVKDARTRVTVTRKLFSRNTWLLLA
ncbi:fungal specific transcription factor domain-containing protein [Fusarium austroafricanum]|uniref:Fungal specific transcription factor domain-containing protein n=1 Tax=Fusarium austroafricanum TaxID=2364996 RepID=A0A8H4KFI7_9HYPO|nr:fungal specific transcription factor domain-containing protein [Fusarium austroafricanum]